MTNNIKKSGRKSALNLIYNMSTSYIENNKKKSNCFGDCKHNNIIFGDSKESNFLIGSNQNDIILSGSGNDTLHGGIGDDYLSGGTGDDYLSGGPGNDVLEGDFGNDKLVGDSGDDFIIGGDGKDTLEGGSGNDNLQGGSGNDIIDGGLGNDTLEGYSGNDTLVGGSGNNIIYGDHGDDILLLPYPIDKYKYIYPNKLINTLTGDINTFYDIEKFIFNNTKTILYNDLYIVNKISLDISGDITGVGDEDTSIKGKINVLNSNEIYINDFSITTKPINGVAYIEALSGSWSYIPNNNYFGEDQFTVTITDYLDYKTKQNITIKINPINDPTIISGDISGLCYINTSINGKLNVIDNDDFNENIFSILENPSNGNAEINSHTGSWNYIPNKDFVGDDKFTVKISDSLGNVETQNINLIIKLLNEPSIISGDIYTTGDENIIINGKLNVTDNNGLSGNNFFIDKNPNNGLALIHSSTGNWNYLPNNNFSGEDKFTVSIVDDLGFKTLQDITIIINQVNDEPIISGDINVIGDEDTNLNGKLNVIDHDGTNTFYIFMMPLNGNAHVNYVSGEWNYYPNKNFYGDDKFTINILDSLGNITKQDINIKINPINDPSIIVDGIIGYGEINGIIRDKLKVIDNDGLSGNNFSITKLANNGFCQINSTTGSWQYNPNNNFSGEDKFTVNILDDSQNSISQDINLFINNIKDHSICESLLCINLSLKKGWNLLYNPFDYNIIYDGSDIIYNEYTKSNVIKENTSFWIKSDEEKEVIIDISKDVNKRKSELLPNQNVLIHPGWSIFGIEKEYKFYGDVLIFKFTDNGYQEIINGRLLRPFVGYWIYSSNANSIILV